MLRSKISETSVFFQSSSLSSIESFSPSLVEFFSPLILHSSSLSAIQSFSSLSPTILHSWNPTVYLFLSFIYNSSLQSFPSSLQLIRLSLGWYFSPNALPSFSFPSLQSGSSSFLQFFSFSSLHPFRQPASPRGHDTQQSPSPPTKISICFHNEFHISRHERIYSFHLSRTFFATIFFLSLLAVNGELMSPME